METKVYNELIRTFYPCYDPSEIGISDDEILTVKEWIAKYRNKVKSKQDIIWLICRKEFMIEKNLRLFAVWCTRYSFKFFKVVSKEMIQACNIAEQFALGNLSKEELDNFKSILYVSVLYYDAQHAAYDASTYAVSNVLNQINEATISHVVWNAEIDQLLTYF